MRMNRVIFIIVSRKCENSDKFIIIALILKIFFSSDVDDNFVYISESEKFFFIIKFSF